MINSDRTVCGAAVRPTFHVAALEAGGRPLLSPPNAPHLVLTLQVCYMILPSMGARTEGECWEQRLHLKRQCTVMKCVSVFCDDILSL